MICMIILQTKLITIDLAIFLHNKLATTLDKYYKIVANFYKYLETIT